MRFPDLLNEVRHLQEKVRVLGVDLGYCIAEIQNLRNALVAALPEAESYLSVDLPVSRETVREVNDRGAQTLF